MTKRTTSAIIQDIHNLAYDLQDSIAEERDKAYEAYDVGYQQGFADGEKSGYEKGLKRGREEVGSKV